ncbi:MAG: hypothetical protein PWP63_679 [Methanolobus sp.]|nr:hypothetical protein [Methanolobus sp.]
MNKNIRLLLFGFILLMFTGAAMGLSGPSGLSETATGPTWITWSWTNPTDADFNGTNIYIGGSQVATLGSSVSTYNATGLSPSTSYEIRVETVNTTGVVGGSLTDSAITSSDTIAPGPVTGLAESAKGPTWITWSWTNPSDSDFNGTVIYIGGSQVATLGSSVSTYNATGLNASTSYVIGVATKDLAGNMGSSVSDSASTTSDTDTTPPDPVTGLTASSITGSSITWGWTNPSDADFAGTVIYIDGSQVTTLGNTTSSYTATGLSSSASHSIGVRTKDLSGNLGNWANASATTTADTGEPGSVTSLSVDSKGSDWIKWKWTNPTDSDFDHVMVYINNVFVTNVSANSYTANNLSASTSYTIKLHTVDDAGNINNADVTNTTSTYHKSYLTGDRIWDEDANQSTTYTWDAKSFSGFFYDLETGFSSETMTITDISRTIGDGKLVYRTEPVDSNFEHSGWGKYQVIGFMAEKYFAGYTSNTTITGVDRVSLISSGQLSKVLIDNDDKKSVYSGSSLTLEDGYKLNIVQVDKNGDKVFVTLTKDGDELDSAVISGSGDYIYKTDLGDSDDVIIVAVRFTSIFSSTESNAVTIQGIFQISEDYIELEDGASYGKMEISGFSDNYIEMENDGSISLSKGKIIPVMGKIKFIVADSDTLRFAPFVDMSSPGTYELRGTVAEDDEKLTWTPLNFEGFYYDIDEGIQTEKLELKEINDRSIPKNKLVYTSTPKAVSFEHSSWGSFNVIGFMAEKYFAGYPSGAFGSSSSVDILSDGLLSKVLIDEDDKKSVYSGSSLVLEEGYALNIVQVDKNGDKVMVTLTKDGDEVDTSIISGSGTYIYEKDLGDSDDVPLIAIHFDSIFSGTESNAVFVKGIFQISEDYLEIEDGDTFGKMEVTGIGGSITMSNKDSISLSKGKSIAIMGDVSINVADSSTVRYYPYVEVTTTPSQSLSVSLDNSITTKGSKVTVTVTSRGAAVSEATVKAGSSTVGTTDDEGRITYTASTIGTIKITASKDGYASGSSELEIISPDDDSRKIILEVSPQEVYEGSSVTFFVLKAIGGDAVEGATVSYDGKSIGSTSSQGTVTYTVTNPGMHKLTAVKSGFLDASMNLEVKELAAKFEFTNLVITPLDVRQGKEATFSVDVKNVGTAAGNYTVDLKVNDTVVGTKTVSLGIGESETLEFKHAEKEPGTYTVKVADLTTTYEVFERSGVIWYALGAIAVVIVGGLGYLFTAGGWTVDMAQAKVDEAIQTIKELVSKR